MKRSIYIYNNGTLQRKDNTIRFIDEYENKKIFQLNPLVRFT